MILADTSVWVEHLRRGSLPLARLLEEGSVATHPFVIGEISLGHLNRRGEILGLLEELPAATLATEREVRALVERHGLAGSGIGWIDAHLLAAAALDRLSLWTLDRRLARAAHRLEPASDE